VDSRIYAERVKMRPTAPPAHGAAQSSSRATWRSLLLFWLPLFSLVLMLWLTGAGAVGIWQDEGLTLYQIRQPFQEILTNRIPVAHLVTQNTVPPLYFLTLAAWGRVLGYDLWVLRLFSIFSAVLVVVVLYRVGSWMDGPRTGRIAAALGALSPLYLWYAQELRMYTFLLVPATLSVGLLWQFARRRHHGAQAWLLAAAYLVSAGAMIWTHYLAFFLVAVQVGWLGLVSLRHRPLLLLATAGALLALAVPLVPFALERLRAGVERDFFFLPLPVVVNDLVHSFAFGLPHFMSRTGEVAHAIPLVWVLLGWGLWQSWRRGGWRLLLLMGAGLAGPVLALGALSHIKPLYQNARHLIFVSPVFYLLWAMGLSRLFEIRRWLPFVVIVLFLPGWMLSVNRYFGSEEPLKNDVRPLFEYLASQYTPGDVVALNDPVLQHSLEYFAPGVPWTVLPPYGAPMAESIVVPVYEEVAQRYERVWYVFGPADSTFDTWEHPYNWLSDHYAQLDYVLFPGQTVIGAAYFDTQGPIVQESPFPVAAPADVRFSGGIRFLGLFDGLDSIVAGKRFALETLWTVEEQPARDLQVVLRLTDRQERLWHQEQFLPFGGLHRTTSWLPGQYVRLPLFPELPPTLPAGEYRLELYFVTSDGRVAFPEASTAPLSVGVLEVERAQRMAQIHGTRVGDGLRVEAGAIPGTLPPAASFVLPVRVALESDDRLPDRWLFQLRDEAGESPWSHAVGISEGLPDQGGQGSRSNTGNLQEGDVWELLYPIQLPAGLAGRYRLYLSALEGEATVPVRGWWGLREEPEMLLQTIEVEARAIREVVPPLDQRVDQEWPGHVSLLGYAQEHAGEGGVQVVLVWQAVAPTEQAYKVFLHVVDEHGRLLAPLDSTFDVPSPLWENGEIVLSHHLLEAGLLPPGEYRMLVGIYDERSGERLPVDLPDAAVPAGTIEVGP
jgi:hypothetical protein